MGSGSIDNVAGLAAELDVAFDSSVDVGFDTSFIDLAFDASQESGLDSYLDIALDSSADKVSDPLIDAPGTEPLKPFTPSSSDNRVIESAPLNKSSANNRPVTSPGPAPASANVATESTLDVAFDSPIDASRGRLPNPSLIASRERAVKACRNVPVNSLGAPRKKPVDPSFNPSRSEPSITIPTVQVQPASSPSAAQHKDIQHRSQLQSRHRRDASNASASSEVTISQAPPEHPIPCMQGAFEESIKDSMNPKKLAEKLGVEARRQQILELDEPDQGYSSRWHQKPDSKYHPLWKLIAQISFGVHLLHKQLAKSDNDVVKILQGHVDEVDGFVEETLADFDLATKDIDDRLQALMLPLEHSRTFNRMLCDKTFRQSIIDGNDIIERIVERTAAAMRRSLQDVGEAQVATTELSKFLDRLQSEWAKDKPKRIAIFIAMRGNAQGWLRCFDDMQAKAEHLTKLMSRLTCVVDEVAKRCGIASRRKTPTGTVGRKSTQSLPHTDSPPNSESPRRRSSRQLDKPLPPPPLRQKNAASVIHNSPPPAQLQPQKPQRPSLISNASAQTIDCIRPSAPALNAAGMRSPDGSQHPSPVVAREQARAVRAVSHQTGVDQIEHAQALRKLRSPNVAPQNGTTSPPSPSKLHQKSNPALAASARTITPPVSPPATQPQHNHHDPYRIPPRETSRVKPAQLAGLGIDPSTLRTHSAASSMKDFSCLDKMVPLGPAKPTVTQIRPPESTEMGTTSASRATSPTKPVLKSFSVFPSTVDPRLRTSSSIDDTVRSERLTPRASTDSRASDKIVVAAPGFKEGSTASSAMDSAYQSLLDTPSLSPTNSNGQLESGQPSSVFPHTPDDISPYGALRSHPITASMYIPAPDLPEPDSPLTALPPYRAPTTQQDVPDEDFLMPPGASKRPALIKKPSMNSVKTLFAKKPPKKEPYMGSGGLGGFVAVT